MQSFFILLKKIYKIRFYHFFLIIKLNRKSSLALDVSKIIDMFITIVSVIGYTFKTKIISDQIKILIFKIQ